MFVFYCQSNVCFNGFFSVWNVKRTLWWDLFSHCQHLGGCWVYVFQCNIGFVSYGMYFKMQIACVVFDPVLLFLCLFRLFFFYVLCSLLIEVTYGGGYDV